MNLVYPLAHLLGGFMLLLAFGLLAQRRIIAMIALYQAEAITLTAACLWQGFAQHSPDLVITGAITLALKAIVLPIALRRLAHRFNLIRTIEVSLPVGVSMVLGVVLVAIAVQVTLPITLHAVTLTREDIAIALSIILLGLLMMITRRNALSQVIGFLSTENGLVLAAIGMPGMPYVAELSAALLVLIAFFVFGVFVFRIRERFDTLDVGALEAIEKRGR
jgi:hydrogenase-4 component E